MVKIKLENVVASAVFERGLDIKAVSLRMEGAEYNPERFPGLIYRLRNPKVALLLFGSGKCVCTGAKNVEDIHTALRIVTRQMKKAGFSIEAPSNIVIQNIVATFDVGANLNLNSIAITLGLERVEYEPEQFPGLVYRMDDPKIVMLFFGSGKVVCTGAKNAKEIEEAAKKLIAELKIAGLLGSKPNSD